MDGLERNPEVLEHRADLQAYHQSIANELSSIHSRIRQLIGNSHWLTDGEYKEAILRRVFRNHVSEIIRVGTGFVCYPDGQTSNQIDILFTDIRKPTLFKDEGLTIVTIDTVKAIIEVKTSLSTTKLREALIKLGDNADRIRHQNPDCIVGLFIYEADGLDGKKLLRALNTAARSTPNRIINFVSVGNEIFAQYSEREISGKGGSAPLWYVYQLPDLAPAYFISHFVWQMTEHRFPDARFAWFPLRNDIRNHTNYRISLYGREIYPVEALH